MSVVSQGTPKRVVLVGTPNVLGTTIAGVTSGSSTGPVNCEGYTCHTLYVVASAALSDGTLIIEERDQPQDVPGQVASITLSTPFASAGGTYAYHVFAPSAFGYLSARIGTTVVGGTIYVVLRSA